MSTYLYEPGMSYLLTMVTKGRNPIFAEPRFARVAHDDISFYAAKFGLVSLAHVVMPDHVHWMVFPSEDGYDRFASEQVQRKTKYAADPARFFLSKIVEDYERHVSYRVNQMRGTQGVAVWQNGFRDDALRTDHAVREAMEYMRMNPVRAGLSEGVEVYSWLAWDAEWLV